MSNNYWSLCSIRIVDNYQEWKQWYKKNEASRGNSDASPHRPDHRFDFRSKFQAIQTLLRTGHIEDDFLGQLVFDVRVRQFLYPYDSVRKCSSSPCLATIVINGFLWWVPIRIGRTAVNPVVKFFSDWRCISNWYVGATLEILWEIFVLLWYCLQTDNINRFTESLHSLPSPRPKVIIICSDCLISFACFPSAPEMPWLCLTLAHSPIPVANFASFLQGW